MNASDLAAGLGLLAFVPLMLMVASAILYVFLPFAVFGIKPKLDQLIRNTHAIYTSLEALRTAGHDITELPYPHDG